MQGACTWHVPFHSLVETLHNVVTSSSIHSSPNLATMPFTYTGCITQMAYSDMAFINFITQPFNLIVFMKEW